MMLKMLEKKSLHFFMVKKKSLVNGIGDIKTTKKYYDDWSKKYDQTLNQWKYTVPKKSVNLIKNRLTKPPSFVLDLACGTGLFGEELRSNFKNIDIYGSDISRKSLNIAKGKKIYKDLIKMNFEKRINYKLKFDLVSMIGAMTYCKNFHKLFLNIKYYLSKNGYFIFSHRVDLWEKQNFQYILEKHKTHFETIYISRPQNYLPLNTDFTNKIKIRLVLLQKISI